MADNSIVAAGAVITRGDGDGREFLLIHRSYRSDWTFPKGKVDPGEHVLAAAVREVREETGFAVRLGLPLPTQRYEVNGAPKSSHYWHAELIGGEWVENDEVDEIRWLKYNDASDLLTYKHDHFVLDAAAVAMPTDPFILMRHTQAAKRAEWLNSKDALSPIDASRPLTAVGRGQAANLVPALAAYGVGRLASSDSRRCRDTVGPYASARSLPITLVPGLSEERHLDDPSEALANVHELATSPGSIALCTHRPVMPTVMNALAEDFAIEAPGSRDFDPALTPGSLVVFHRSQDNPSQVLKVERHIR